MVQCKFLKVTIIVVKSTALKGQIVLFYFCNPLAVRSIIMIPAGNITTKTTTKGLKSGPFQFAVYTIGCQDNRDIDLRFLCCIFLPELQKVCGLNQHVLADLRVWTLPLVISESAIHVFNCTTATQSTPNGGCKVNRTGMPNILFLAFF